MGNVNFGRRWPGLLGCSTGRAPVWFPVLLLFAHCLWCQPEPAGSKSDVLPCSTCLGEYPDIRPIPVLDMRAWPEAYLLPQNDSAEEPIRHTPLSTYAEARPRTEEPGLRQHLGLAKLDPEGISAQNAQNGQTSDDAASPPKQRKKRQSSPSATVGSPGHIFWVVPAFKVNYAGHFKPLTPREKFDEWAQSSYDPEGIGWTALQAGTLEHSSTDGFCGYGHGWAGYAKCLGSMELDANDSSFFGDFVFTVWWHQDPRYFRLGEGGFGRRVLYAISRVFITYNDSGKNVVYSSGLAGTGLGAVMSNLYYPASERTVGHTMSRVAIDLGDTAIYNGSAEFWPDIHQWLQKTF